MPVAWDQTAPGALTGRSSSADFSVAFLGGSIIHIPDDLLHSCVKLFRLQPPVRRLRVTLTQP